MSKCEFLFLFLFFLGKWKYEFSLPEIKKKTRFLPGRFRRRREQKQFSAGRSSQRWVRNAKWLSLGDSWIHESTSRGAFPQVLRETHFTSHGDLGAWLQVNVCPQFVVHFKSKQLYYLKLG